MPNDGNIQAETVAQEAKGIASEALANTHAHDRFNTMRFDMMDNKIEEIKVLIQHLDEKADKQFKSINDKFWSLAIALIMILLTTVGWFITFLLQHAGEIFRG